MVPPWLNDPPSLSDGMIQVRSGPALSKDGGSCVCEEDAVFRFSEDFKSSGEKLLPEIFEHFNL